MVRNIQIGIQLASLRQPFKKSLLTAAHLGAETVEIDARNELRPRDLSHTGLRQLRKMLEDLNLRVAAVSFPTRHGYEVAEDLERRIEATQQAMRMAYELGASVVINRIGQIPAETENTEWDLLVDSLAMLGEYGQHVGTTFAAVTGNEPASEMTRLLSALPVDLIKVDLCPGDLLMHGFSVEDSVQELAESIAHVHASDCTSDQSQSGRREVTIGKGAVDFPALLGMLDANGYGGSVTVRKEAGNVRLAELSKSIQFLKDLRIVV